MEKRRSCLCLALALVGILPAGPLWAFTPTSELTDVSPDHWAYNSIKTLVDRYQVMEGFNDNTFRGAKYVTRYEQAAVLAKVMAKVEEMIASATGTAPAPIIPPSINPEDLRTIARLQQEFRDELTILRGRVDTMDQRLGVLENRVRLHGELGLLSRSFTSPVRGRGNVRVETSLGLDARMAPDLAYSGLLTLFNNGMQFQRNGHLWEEAGARGETTRGDSGSPFYLQRSTFTWTPGNWSLSGGVFRFEDTLPVGSFIKTGFSSLPLWAEGQSGYGFVGTPALNQGYALFKYPNTNRAAWLPGINPAQDLLDPNSSPVNRPGSSPALAVRSDWGPLEWGLGVSSGVPGSDLTLAMADVPNSFPMISAFNRGYSLAKAGLDLGLVRATGYYHLDNGSSLAGGVGNGSGATLDLGNDELGLTASYAQINRPSAYGPVAGYFHEASAGVVSSNFLGTGLGVGVASKAGSIGNPTAGNPFGWTSTGGYLRFPLFSVIPAFTVAAQTSGGNFLGSNYGSGWSAIAELQITSLPLVRIEYDRGKFTGSDTSLLSKEPPTDELFTVGTGIRF